MTVSPKKVTIRAVKPKSSVLQGPATRNLVIMFDGTGNELGRNLSNVLKLYRIAQKNETQLVYYNPGVGTISRISPWQRLRQKFVGVMGLAFGYGLDDNVLGAYRFLVENYEAGDRIYLFGFSRGGWTARVLAGFIHLIGLLAPEQVNMCDSALGTYKKAAKDNQLDLAWHFSRVIGARRVPIEFLGVWDTVASVLVPRPDRFWIPSLETLPYTRQNPSVMCFRHALAVDERRRMFRVAQWNDPQEFEPNPFDKSKTKSQDINQMWFAGVHSDVGGGYAEKDSALSKYPLIWMAEEAKKAGLKISTQMLNHLAYGKARKGSKHQYEPPSPSGVLHKSLTFGWWILEIIPKNIKLQEWKRWSIFWHYIPWAEPRPVEENANIHSSVSERKAAVPKYDPVNLKHK